MIIFDTDVLIWCFKGNSKAAGIVENSQDKTISSVSYMELVQGARDKRELKWIKSFLSDSGIRILPLSENIGHRASIYMDEYSLSGGLTVIDSLIAATASETGAVLCTGNAKHFKIIKDLEITVFRP
jgi:predicted nucleic acid-binding protein